MWRGMLVWGRAHAVPPAEQPPSCRMVMCSSGWVLVEERDRCLLRKGQLHCPVKQHNNSIITAA